MAVYVIGDLHGDYVRFQYYCENLTENDIVIQLGDHGCFYHSKKLNDQTAYQMSQVKPRVIFLRGNHDRYIKTVQGMKTVILNDEIKGGFYHNEKYPNLYFCDMYTCFEIKGKKFMAISGSYSVDKWYRLQNNWNWFEDEQLTEDEKMEFKTFAFGQSVDYILSHTCPYQYRPTHLFLPMIDQSTVDNSMEHFLTEVENNLGYDKWFFGHYHGDEQMWDKGYMLYYKIKQIMED